MKSLFDNVSMQCSKLVTKNYSTSFSLGIYFLNSKLHYPIYSIYGFVRFADEIVDSFEGFDKKQLFTKFKQETYEAIENKISLNPILNAFQNTVQKYRISLDLINTFMHSMEMDLEKINYTQEKYKEYILGSAEVVGLMCLHVFTEGNKNFFEELKPYSMKLGAAFQKINFLRDLKADYQILGRNYFPNVDMNNFSTETKKKLEQEIELDFKDALIGIKKLPKYSQGGVYLAYVYYNALFKKIKKTPASKILTNRIRINNVKKIRLMLSSMLQYKLNLL